MAIRDFFGDIHQQLQADPQMRQRLAGMVQSGLMAGGNPRMNFGQALNITAQQQAEQEMQQQRLAQNATLQQQRLAQDAALRQHAQAFQRQQHADLQKHRAAQLDLQGRNAEKQREPNFHRMAQSGFWDPQSLVEAESAYDAGDSGYLGKLRNRKVINAGEGKAIMAAQDVYNESVGGASRMQSMADQFLSMGSDLQEGWLGEGRGFLRRVFGEDNEKIDLLRTQYNQLRMKHALKTLPAGPASDRDVQLALQGWPAEFSDRRQMYSFLQGMSKLAVIDAAQAQARAEHLNSTKSPGGFIKFWNENKGQYIGDALAAAGLELNDSEDGLSFYDDRFTPVDPPGTRGTGDPLVDEYNDIMGLEVETEPEPERQRPSASEALRRMGMQRY